MSSLNIYHDPTTASLTTLDEEVPGSALVPAFPFHFCPTHLRSCATHVQGQGPANSASEFWDQLPTSVARIII